MTNSIHHIGEGKHKLQCNFFSQKRHLILFIVFALLVEDSVSQNVTH